MFYYHSPIVREKQYPVAGSARKYFSGRMGVSPLEKYYLVKKRRFLTGFTLVELTVVLAIIAILVTIATPNVTNFLRRSRDTARVSDMNVLALALETFFEQEGRYPDTNPPDNISATGEIVGDDTGNIETALRIYIRGSVPEDPLGDNAPGRYYYAYDPEALVDWCDVPTGNDEADVPVLGFNQSETNAITVQKDTCDTGGTTNRNLGNADYNIGFVIQ